MAVVMQMHAPMAPTFVGDQAAMGQSEAMTGGSLLPAEDIPEMPGLSAALAAASAAMQAAGEAMPPPISMHQTSAQVGLLHGICLSTFDPSVNGIPACNVLAQSLLVSCATFFPASFQL